VEECCPPRQKSRVERLRAKVEPLLTQVTVENAPLRGRACPTSHCPTAIPEMADVMTSARPIADRRPVSLSGTFWSKVAEPDASVVMVETGDTAPVTPARDAPYSCCSSR